MVTKGHVGRQDGLENDGSARCWPRNGLVLWPKGGVVKLRARPTRRKHRFFVPPVPLRGSAGPGAVEEQQSWSHGFSSFSEGFHPISMFFEPFCHIF